MVLLKLASPAFDRAFFCCRVIRLTAWWIYRVCRFVRKEEDLFVCLKRDLGEEDLGGGAGELGNRSEWRPMEGSKESAGEEDGRQGGRGIQVGSGVGFSFQMCFYVCKIFS